MIADDFITFSSQFETHGTTVSRARDIAIEISRWLYAHDPHGSGILMEGGIQLTFTDGSSCVINTLDAKVTRLQ